MEGFNVDSSDHNATHFLVGHNRCLVEVRMVVCARAGIAIAYKFS